MGSTAATGGRLLSVWHEVLDVGLALPSMPLALTGDFALNVDLNTTYNRAAAVCYLEVNRPK